MFHFNFKLHCEDDLIQIKLAMTPGDSFLETNFRTSL